MTTTTTTTHVLQAFLDLVASKLEIEPPAERAQLRSQILEVVEAWVAAQHKIELEDDKAADPFAGAILRFDTVVCRQCSGSGTQMHDTGKHARELQKCDRCGGTGRTGERK